MGSRDERVPGQPAPGRDVHRGTFISGEQPENLSGRKLLEATFERQEHGPASQVAGIPSVVLIDWLHAHTAFGRSKGCGLGVQKRHPEPR
jgi:hypothetical protein